MLCQKVKAQNEGKSVIEFFEPDKYNPVFIKNKYTNLDIIITDYYGKVLYDVSIDSLKYEDDDEKVASIERQKIKSNIYNSAFNHDLIELESGNYIRYIVLLDTLLIDSFAIIQEKELRLKSPPDKSINTNSMISFYWHAPGFTLESKQELLYQLSIYELLPNQEKSEALLYNPPVLVQRNLLGTLYFLNASKTLKPGRVYTWKIDAFVNGLYVASSLNNEFIYDTSNLLANLPEINSLYEDQKKQLQDKVRSEVLKLKKRGEKFDVRRVLNKQASVFNVKPPAFTNPLAQYKKKPITLEGYMNIEALYTNRDDSTYYVSNKYAQIDFQPRITILDLPINVYGYYSTDPLVYKQNTLTAQVDFEQFKQNLMNKIASYEEYINQLENKVTDIPSSVDDLKDEYSAYQNLYNFRMNQGYFKDYSTQKLNAYKDKQQLKLNNELNKFKNMPQQYLGQYKDSVEGYMQNIPGKNDILAMAELDHLLNINDPKLKKALEDSLKKYDYAKYELFKDYQRFKSLYDHPPSEDEIKGKLLKSPYLSGIQKVMLAFERFSIGRSYPYYSPMSLAGIPIDGFDAAVNIKNKYISFTHGKSFDYVYTNGLEENYIDRKITGGSFGFGRQDSSHLYLIFMYSDDQLNNDKSDSFIVNNNFLNRNFLLTLKGRYMVEKYLIVDAELSKSVLINKGIADTTITTTTSWFSRMFDREEAENDNLAFNINTLINLPQAKMYLTSSIYRIPNGYRSVFAPYIKRDNVFYDINLSKRLFDDRLEIQAFLKNEHNNVGEWRDFTTYNNRMGIVLAGNPLKNLRISFRYAPAIQKNDADNELYKMFNENNYISSSVLYRKKFKKVSSNTQIMYSNQQINTLTSELNNHILSVNELLLFKKNMQLQAMYSLFESDTFSRNMLDLTFSCVLFKKISNTFGFTYTVQPDELFGYSLVYGLSFPISKKAMFQTRYIHSFYEYTDPETSKNDFFLVGSFGVVF
jgi:hypothetical protein